MALSTDSTGYLAAGAPGRWMWVTSSQSGRALRDAAVRGGGEAAVRRGANAASRTPPPYRAMAERWLELMRTGAVVS